MPCMFELKNFYIQVVYYIVGYSIIRCIVYLKKKKQCKPQTKVHKNFWFETLCD